MTTSAKMAIAITGAKRVQGRVIKKFSTWRLSVRGMVPCGFKSHSGMMTRRCPVRHHNPLVWTSHLAFVTRPIRPTNRVNVASWPGCGTWERSIQLVEVDRPIIRVSVNATLKPPCTNRGVSHCFIIAPPYCCHCRERIALPGASELCQECTRAGFYGRDEIPF